MNSMSKPLDGLLVLEFCQFLAGPSAGLRLADLGARVIKIERPEKGESGRQIAIKNLFIDGDSLVFHTVNRNKESYAADLKDPADLDKIRKLISMADVITHNFRQGVMEKIGLDYIEVRKINPRVVYGVVSGYGNKGPWVTKPGQDLLVQSISGLTWLTGSKDDGPVPFGLAVADMICGAHLVQGILAALIKRGRTGKSVLIEVSLLESVLDIQFEVLTTFLNDGHKLPERGEAKGSAHAYLGAPYGIYKTQDGYIAMAMGNLLEIGRAIGSDSEFEIYRDSKIWFSQRNEITVAVGALLRDKKTEEWLDVLRPKGIWCAEVMNYKESLEHEAVKRIKMDQVVKLPDGRELKTTRCPVKIDGNTLYSTVPAPKTGAHTSKINEEFNII
jgi:CoA:oxalate CoA-transferase